MNRPILLAIGLAAALFSMAAGTRLDHGVAGVSGAARRAVAAARRDAGLEILKRAKIVREVTAYNVGIQEQTSDDPCIGAAGQDLCRLVRRGVNVCAANFVELGTVLRIEGYGECVVLDRMNSRFPHRVDIAMAEDEVEEALEFGVSDRVVEVKD